MSKGKFEQKGRGRRRHRTFGSKSLALVLACVLLVGGIVGGTIAWLTANSNAVTNTFTESDIDITLSEKEPENKTAQMVPGWTIDKDPKVKVEDGSEDCWLFVKITESTNPDLDAYIAYAIADGWQIVESTDNGTPVTSIANADEIVIGRKVYKDDATKEFSILGAGEYTDPMGTTDVTADDFKITWTADQVCVKPSVTEAMMTAITGDGKAQPTLSFQAYAVQLFKTNSDGNKGTTTDEFTASEAWARAAAMSSTMNS